MIDPGYWSVDDVAPTHRIGNRQARRRRPTRDGRSNRRAFRPGHLGGAWEQLEARRLMDGSSDLTQEIANFLSTKGPSGQETLPNVTVGKFLSSPSVTVMWANVTQSGSNWSGTVTVTANSADLAIGSELTGSIAGDDQVAQGLSGSYTLDDQPLLDGSYALSVEQLSVTDPSVFTATASKLTLDYSSTEAAGTTIISAGSVSATFAPLNNAAITLDNLAIKDDGFSVDSVSAATDSSFTLGSVLSVTNPSVTATGLSYTDGATPAATGTITLKASNATLFPKASGFTASVDNFSGTYNLTTSALSVTADDINVGVGNVLTGLATGVTIAYNPGDSEPISITAQSEALTSTLFPGATANVTNPVFNSDGFSVASADLKAPQITLGKVLGITNLNLNVQNFGYTTSTGNLTGTIAVSADSASILPGATKFTTTVDGFTGSIDLTTQAVSLQATDATISVGSALTVMANGLGFSLAPNSSSPTADDTVNVTVASATASLPQEGLTGAVSSLTISNNGFQIGQATLSNTGSVSAFGGKFTVVAPSVSLTGFDYDSGKANFDSDLTLTATSVNFNPTATTSLVATGTATSPLAATISFTTSDIGDFKFTAAQVNASLGAYLTLAASNVSFDSSPTTGNNIASFGSFSATVKAGNLTASGTGKDFAINSSGQLVALPGFGVSVILTGSGASKLNLPSWLPIQIQSLSLDWPNFNSDPTSFTLDVSASVGGSIGSNRVTTLSGSVEGLQIDTGILQQDATKNQTADPIVGLTSATLTVGGKLFGLAISGSIDAGLLNVDSSGNIIPSGASTPVARKIFYGALDGSVMTVDNIGLKVQFGMTDIGPVDTFVSISAPIPLGPSGLVLSNLNAGIAFDSPLADPAGTTPLDQAKTLATDPAYTLPQDQTVAEYQANFLKAVANQVKSAAGGSYSVLAEPMTITGGATIYDAVGGPKAFSIQGGFLFDTTGKIETVGTLTVGSAVSIHAAAFFDLSQVTNGQVTILAYAKAPAPTAATASTPTVTSLLNVYGSLTLNASANNVAISISGEADMTLPGLSAGLNVSGSVTITSQATNRALGISLQGTASLEPLGASVSLAAAIQYDDPASGPELYGAALVTDNGSLGGLSKVGVDVKTAVAVVRFNTSDNQQTILLPTPGSTATTPETLPEDSADVFISGDVLIAKQVDINGSLYAHFTSDGASGPELDVAVAGTASIAKSPADSTTALKLDASGILLISAAGLAANLSVTLNDGSGLSQSGVTLNVAGTLGFVINTTGKDASFSVPVFLDQNGVQYPGSGVTYTVPAAPAVNVAGVAAPAGGYFLLTGSGDLLLSKNPNASKTTGLDLSGHFDLLITSTAFSVDFNDTLNVDVNGTALLGFGAQGSLTVYGDDNPTGPGIIGAVQLTAGTNLPKGGKDFDFNASFLLGINTTNSDTTTTTQTIPANTEELIATGDLLIGPANAQFDLNGTVDVTVTNNPTTNLPAGLNFHVDAKAQLPLLGSLTADGDLTISSDGLYGDLTIASNITAFAGFSLGGQFNLQFNSTDTAESVNIAQSGQPSDLVTLPADQFQVDIQNAQLTISQALTLNGALDLTLNGSGFSVEGNVGLTLLRQKLLSAGIFASIYQDSTGAPQLALYAGLSVGGNLQGSGFSINVGQAFVEVNTGLTDVNTNAPTGGSSLVPAVIPARTVEVGLENAAINAFGFQASGSLFVTVSHGDLDINIPESNPLSINFLKFGNLGFYGDLNSDGSFSLTAEAGYNVRLGSDTTALLLNGSIYVMISNHGFAAGLAGSAQLDLSGSITTLASVSADLAIDSGYFELDASVSLGSLHLGFKDSFGKAPTPPAGQAGLTFLAVPTYAAAGSDVQLSAGINDSSGNPIADGNYEWDVTPPSGSTATSSSSRSANDTVVLDKPGAYAVALYDDSNNGHTLVSQATITVADQAPVISTLGLAAVYPVGQNNLVTINPTVVTPVDTSAHPIKITYSVTKNGATFTNFYDTANELELIPDTPKNGSADTYVVTATVDDTYGGVTSLTSSFRTLDINNIIVNTTVDRPIDPGYIGADGTITLRDAVAFANTLASNGNSINLNPTIRFAPSLAGQTIHLNRRDTSSTSVGGTTALIIDQPMTIDGSDAPGLTIAVDPGNILRVFAIQPQVQQSAIGSFFVSVSHVNITGGFTEDSAFASDHDPTGAEGGAFYVGAYDNLTLSDVALVGNTAVGFGDPSTNTAGLGRGGAVYVSANGGFGATNVTIADNTAKGYTSADMGQGSAIFADGALVINQSTVVNNSIVDNVPGAAIEVENSQIQLYNSIVANNTGGPNLSIQNPIAVVGSNNLYSDQPGAGSAAYPLGSTYSSAALKLGSLAARGDGIESVSLLPGSPAINGGSVSDTYDRNDDATDVRGLPRVVNNTIDIGSYEHQADVVTNTHSSGPGSLANAVATDDDGSPIVFATGVMGAINLISTLVPQSDITITGPSANLLAIDGGGVIQILDNASRTVTISGLTLRNGFAPNGGAIDNAGTLTLNQVALLNNVAEAPAASSNPFALTPAGLTNATPQAYGGAIDNEKSGTLNLTGDTFANNAIVTIGKDAAVSFGHGGAIANAGTVTADTDTFADNTATSGNGLGLTVGFGGAIDNTGTLTVRESTFARNNQPENNSQGLGADIFNDTSGIVGIINSILANPLADVDLLNNGTVLGLNDLIMSSANVPSGVIISTADPLLRPLSNYGGPTPTLDPSPNSPAVGRAIVLGTATDQRGYARTVNGSQDLGAVEIQYFTVINGNDSGPGSLRQAVLNDHDDTPITFATGLRQINLTSGPIVVDHDLIVDGPGANVLTVAGGGKTGLFQVDAGSSVTLQGLTLAQGQAAQGGAIDNRGTLTVDAAEFTSNVASSGVDGGSGLGGAILNEAGATLTVNDSTFTGNRAVGSMGVTLPGGNGEGGAIKNVAGGQATLSNDTFYSNAAQAIASSYNFHPLPAGQAFGGAIDNDGNLEVVNSTLDQNLAIPNSSHAALGSDIHSDGSLTLFNTIAAKSSSQIDDIDATGKVTGSGNLVMTSTGLPAGLVASNANPLLQSLANNGGETLTQALGVGSPAFAAGDAAAAAGLDQTGNPRLVGGVVDIGSVQSQVPLVTPSAGTGYTIHYDDSLTLHATTTNPANRTLTYSWDISSPSATTFSFTAATTAQPILTAGSLQILGLGIGTYAVRVRVDDGLGGLHAVVSPPVTLTILPPLAVTSLTPAVSGPTKTPVDSAIVVTTDPIPLSSLTAPGVLTFNATGPVGQSIPFGPAKLVITPVAGKTNTYQISGLAAFEGGDRTYTLTLNAGALNDGYGPGSGTISATWLLDTKAPTSRVSPLPPRTTTPTFTVSAIGSDTSSGGATASGVASYALYVSIDGGPFAYWTTVPAASPLAVYTPVGGHSYSFQSFATDNAGNLETKPTTAEASTFVPIITPPQANVVSVDTSTSTLIVGYAQAANGNTSLSRINLFVSVDGEAATQFATVTTANGSTTYQALTDGLKHTYGFYAVAVDTLGNIQATPATPDVTVSALFGTIPGQLGAGPDDPLSLTVDHGASGRSYVRYVDLAFGSADGLTDLISGGHIHLIQHDLNGGGSTPVNLAGVLHVVDNAIEFDFGAAGIGGNADSTLGDGYYEIDLDGDSRAFYFDRLFGDVNGDGTVDNTDVSLVTSVLGSSNGSGAVDIDGTGTVTATNRALVLRAKGHTLASGLHLDA